MNIKLIHPLDKEIYQNLISTLIKILNQCNNQAKIKK
jgi:hypothetical protein